MCTHTHITRSDYLEGLVARQKLGGGSTIQHVSQGPRDKEVEVEADWRVWGRIPHPMGRRHTSTPTINILLQCISGLVLCET